MLDNILQVEDFTWLTPCYLNSPLGALSVDVKIYRLTLTDIFPLSLYNFQKKVYRLPPPKNRIKEREQEICYDGQKGG